MLARAPSAGGKRVDASPRRSGGKPSRSGRDENGVRCLRAARQGFRSCGPHPGPYGLFTAWVTVIATQPTPSATGRAWRRLPPKRWSGAPGAADAEMPGVPTIRIMARDLVIMRRGVARLVSAGPASASPPSPSEASLTAQTPRGGPATSMRPEALRPAVADSLPFSTGPGSACLHKRYIRASSAVLTKCLQSCDFSRVQKNRPGASRKM